MDTDAPKKPSKLLPANAYTKLAPGEEYQPIVPANRPAGGGNRVVGHAWPDHGCGVLRRVHLHGPSAGNAIEAAIPIAIMAIFFGRKGLKRSGKSTMLENVIVQSIGQAAGVVAAGAAFIIPAFYINGLEVHWWQTFLACSIGGFLGTC